MGGCDLGVIVIEGSSEVAVEESLCILEKDIPESEENQRESLF